MNLEKSPLRKTSIPFPQKICDCVAFPLSLHNPHRPWGLTNTCTGPRSRSRPSAGCRDAERRPETGLHVCVHPLTLSCTRTPLPWLPHRSEDRGPVEDTSGTRRIRTPDIIRSEEMGHKYFRNSQTVWLCPICGYYWSRAWGGLGKGDFCE